MARPHTLLYGQRNGQREEAKEVPAMTLCGAQGRNGNEVPAMALCGGRGNKDPRPTTILWQYR